MATAAEGGTGLDTEMLQVTSTANAGIVTSSVTCSPPDDTSSAPSEEGCKTPAEVLANGGVQGILEGAGAERPLPNRKDSRDRLLALHQQRPLKPEDEIEMEQKQEKRKRSKAEWDKTLLKFHEEVTIAAISSPTSPAEPPEGGFTFTATGAGTDPAGGHSDKVTDPVANIAGVTESESDDRGASKPEVPRRNSGKHFSALSRSQKIKGRPLNCQSKACESNERCTCKRSQGAVRTLSETRLLPLKERRLERQPPELELLPVPGQGGATGSQLSPSVPTISINNSHVLEHSVSDPAKHNNNSDRTLEHSASVPAYSDDLHSTLKKSKSVTFQGEDMTSPYDLVVAVPDASYTDMRRSRLDSDKRGSRTLSVSSIADDASDGGSSPAAKGHRKLSRKWSNFSFRSTFSFRSMDGRTSSVSSALNGIGGNSLEGEPEAPKQPCKCTKQHGKAAIGVLVMAVGAACWVGATQIIERLNFPPFFVVYFSSCWIVVCFPGYVIARVFKTRCKLSFKDTFRDNFRVFTSDALAPCAPHKVIAKLTAFTVVWMLTCYVYIRALTFKSPLDVNALFATNSNFVYLMSWIVLQKKFIAIRIVSFIVAMTGIIMITYVESGIASQDMWGSVLVMVATAGAAAYKVLFRKIFGDVTYGQQSMFITCMGLFLATTMWPLLLLLAFTEAEPIVWQEVPWVYLSITAALVLSLKIILIYGPVITQQPFVQASLVFAIPVCVGVEVLWKWDDFNVVGMQIAAYILIVLSFLLNVLPEDWHESVLKALHWKSRQDWSDDAHMTPRQRIRHTGVRQV